MGDSNTRNERKYKRMAHKIQNNMIAFKGETPWHGLGVAVTPEMTGAEMLIAAKMAWRVQRRRLAMRDAQGQGLVVDPLAGYRAIVREDTDEVFQVATAKYHPVQNEHIVEFFREFCEAGHASMETVGAIEGGKKVWALAKLNGGSGTTLQGVDELKGYMLLATSHDGSLLTIGKATQVRVVCWNTLSAALGIGGGNRTQAEEGTFRLKHSAKFTSEQQDKARRVMGMAVEQIAVTNEIADKLSRVSIDQQGREEYVLRLLGGQSLLEQVAVNTDGNHQAIGAGVLEAMLSTSNGIGDTKTSEGDSLGRLGKAILEAIVDSPGSTLVTAKDTLWGAVNGVTYYTDHVRGRSQDTRLSSAWFGQSDRLKRDAVKVAYEMAGVTVEQKQAVWA